jgi:hypothetical protein
MRPENRADGMMGSDRVSSPKMNMAAASPLSRTNLVMRQRPPGLFLWDGRQGLADN